MAQAICLYFLTKFSKPEVFFGKNQSLFFLALLVLSLVSTTIWLDALAAHTRKVYKLTASKFFYRCLNVLIISISAIISMLILRLFLIHWVFLVLTSSLISGTAVIGMLASVLFEISYLKALGLALDAWRKRISLAAIAAFCVILSHGAAYALVHSAVNNVGHREFSVLNHSATIWMLFVVVALVIGFITALINCFLVILFLETIRPVKDTEEKSAVSPALVNEANL